MPYVVGFLFVVFLIQKAKEHYEIVLFVAAIIVVIVAFCRIDKAIRMKAERKEQERQAKIRQAAEQRRKQEEKKKAQRVKEEEIARFRSAQRSGEDVCLICETIHPKRCSNPKCHKCLSGRQLCRGNRIWYSSDECEECYWKRRQREYDIAVKKGYAVCDHCLAVEPRQCRDCNGCIEHRGYGGDGLCRPCYDSIYDYLDD